ncbi:MAG: ATP-grasp domain-containing protein [Ilumatobacteraceae bacterium]
MNVLITCAGRRSYLVEWFRHAVAPEGLVVATNSQAEATAMVVADLAVVAPPLASDGYIDFLLDVCRREQIALVVPVFDLELPVLAGAISRFAAAGVRVAVSAPDVIALCQDKLATVDIARRAGLTAPRTTLDPAEAAGWLGAGADRVFVKPRRGTGSIATWSTSEADEIELLHRKVHRDLRSTYLAEPGGSDDVVVQEGVRGVEHGLTVVNDFAGRFQCVLAHRKLAMRAGETDAAVTVDAPRLHAAGRALADELGHVGALDVDVFVHGDDVAVLDLNVRIGGNYPFAHLAGADLPAAYVAWAGGRTVDGDLFAIDPGIVALKSIDVIRAGGSLRSLGRTRPA